MTPDVIPEPAQVVAATPVEKMLSLDEAAKDLIEESDKSQSLVMINQRVHLRRVLVYMNEIKPR